jgi:KUP system potassium uptake protein
MTAIEQRDGEPSNVETMPAETGPHHGAIGAMAIGTLGVVYGDIGTSPLYTFKTAIEWAGGEATPAAALGSLKFLRM